MNTKTNENQNENQNENKNDERKQITINGINNKYQIKKVTQKKELPKTRQEVKKWKINNDYFSKDEQLDLLQKEEGQYYFLLVQQIERKIQSYKHQDMEKKRVDEKNFISLKGVIELLCNSHLSCYYCKEDIFILYKIVRENKQWTLDRINNDIGHNTGNVIISCLECNLKRRRQTKDNYLFTKQLKIVQIEKNVDNNKKLN